MGHWQRLMWGNKSLPVSRAWQLPFLCSIPSESCKAAVTLFTHCTDTQPLTQRAEGSCHTLPHILEEIHTGILRWTRSFGFKKQNQDLFNLQYISQCSDVPGTPILNWGLSWQPTLKPFPQSLPLPSVTLVLQAQGGLSTHSVSY